MSTYVFTEFHRVFDENEVLMFAIFIFYGRGENNRLGEGLVKYVLLGIDILSTCNIKLHFVKCRQWNNLLQNELGSLKVQY